MATPTPFKIAVADSFLAQTREKLLNARLPDQLVDTTWEGTPDLPQSPNPIAPIPDRAVSCQTSSPFRVRPISSSLREY
jgi:hypothetical protein